MIKFIFYGRLSEEKWFDLIIKRINKYKWSQIISNIYIDIFGDGVLSRNLQGTILSNWIENIKYHGWQTQSVIAKYISDANYTLIPSRFIETFGLSALESCELWKPIIWRAKWWLEQFILPELDLSNYNSDSEFWQFEKCMDYIINTMDNNIYIWLSRSSSRISKQFTKKNWIREWSEIVK